MSNTREKTIPEFFSGLNLFVTGATGFMGKVLLEKLLRSCPDIGTIYILMRPKRGRDLQERLQELVQQKVYDRLREERPGILEQKLKPIAGDVTELNLGLSESDRNEIINEVSIIYHVAASVRFDDLLKDAVILNMRGTREVCQLALETKNLAALVHVSTAFVNCDRSEANEELYTPKADWRKTIELAEKCDGNLLNVLTNKYVDNMPNTYTFTKSLGEHIVFDMCKGKIPVKIIRPSIVVSSLKEPVEGWIDNFNGPVGLLIACGKGLMRTHHVKMQNKPDYIPVDIAIKAMVVATWDLALRKNTTEPEIMHCTSHKIDWARPSTETLRNIAIELTPELPLNDIMWVPSGHYTSIMGIWYIRVLFSQLLPALLIDGIMKITGKKAILTKIQRRMFIAQFALKYFINNEWVYPNERLLELRKTVLDTDMENWNFDFDEYDLKTYVRHAVLGARRYLLNEPDDTLIAAKKHYIRMKWIDRITKILFYIFIFWLIWQLDLYNMAQAKIERIGQQISKHFEL